MCFGAQLSDMGDIEKQMDRPGRLTPSGLVSAEDLSDLESWDDQFAATEDPLDPALESLADRFDQLELAVNERLAEEEGDAIALLDARLERIEKLLEAHATVSTVVPDLSDQIDAAVTTALTPVLEKFNAVELSPPDLSQVSDALQDLTPLPGRLDKIDATLASLSCASVLEDILAGLDERLAQIPQTDMAPDLNQITTQLAAIQATVDAARKEAIPSENPQPDLADKINTALAPVLEKLNAVDLSPPDLSHISDALQGLTPLPVRLDELDSVLKSLLTAPSLEDILVGIDQRLAPQSQPDMTPDIAQIKSQLSAMQKTLDTTQDEAKSSETLQLLLAALGRIETRLVVPARAQIDLTLLHQSVARQNTAINTVLRRLETSCDALSVAEQKPPPDFSSEIADITKAISDLATFIQNKPAPAVPALDMTPFRLSIARQNEATSTVLQRLEAVIETLSSDDQPLVDDAMLSVDKDADGAGDRPVALDMLASLPEQLRYSLAEQIASQLKRDAHFSG